MADHDQRDKVWEHGENIYPRFTCKYCKQSKKEDGATRFKQHLAGRDNNVVHCTFVPPDVHDYFRRELDRAADRRRHKQQESLRREDIVAEGNVSHEGIDDVDEELQRALHISREEKAYAR